MDTFNPEIAGTGTIAALGLDCAISVLCYTDIAITKQPDKKAEKWEYNSYCIV